MALEEQLFEDMVRVLRRLHQTLRNRFGGRRGLSRRQVERASREAVRDWLRDDPEADRVRQQLSDRDFEQRVRAEVDRTLAENGYGPLDPNTDLNRNLVPDNQDRITEDLDERREQDLENDEDREERTDELDDGREDREQPVEQEDRAETVEQEDRAETVEEDGPEAEREEDREQEPEDDRDKEREEPEVVGPVTSAAVAAETLDELQGQEPNEQVQDQQPEEQQPAVQEPEVQEQQVDVRGQGGEAAPQVVLPTAEDERVAREQGEQVPDPVEAPLDVDQGERAAPEQSGVVPDPVEARLEADRRERAGQPAGGQLSGQGDGLGPGEKKGISAEERARLQGIQSGQTEATRATQQEQGGEPVVAGTAGRNPGAQHAKLTGRGPGRGTGDRGSDGAGLQQE